MTDLADQRIVDRAHATAETIVEARAASRQNLWVLAAALHAFTEERMWAPLGFDTLEEWLASPEIELRRTHVFRLTRVYRSLVIERQVPPAELEGVDVTKADVVLAAVRDGRTDVSEALADARALTRKDLEAKYGSADPSGGGEEPARVQCDACGSFYVPKVAA